LSFSSRLAAAPPDVLEHIVIHELRHLRGAAATMTAIVVNARPRPPEVDRHRESDYSPARGIQGRVERRDPHISPQ
jgi:hypothetical protein